MITGDPPPVLSDDMMETQLSVLSLSLAISSTAPVMPASFPPR